MLQKDKGVFQMWASDETDRISEAADLRYELTMDEFYYHFDTLRRISLFPLNQAIYIQATICLERCKTLYDRAMDFANTPEQKQAAYKAYQDCVKQCGWRAH
ncbi:MAG: hypothetical protein K0R78_1235 [Pelosinus sp.]|jgi:hypothetical protein|nr:hypothetical protein [Pelosinus sp.]